MKRFLIVAALVAACDAPQTPDVKNPPGGGLAAWWPLDDLDVEVRDRSGNGNTATSRGARRVLGKVGDARTFDGAACVTARDSSSLSMAGATSLSMMAWVRAPVRVICSQGIQAVLAKEGEYEHGIRCGASPVYQSAVSTDAGPTWVWAGSAPLSPDVWHHVATTWDGAVVRSYVDGVLVEERPLGGRLKPALGPSGVGIGCGNVAPDGASSTVYSFIGAVDEATVYRRALSAEEISMYYRRTR